VPTTEGWVFANPMTNRPYHRPRSKSGTFALLDAVWSRVRRAVRYRACGAGKVSPRQTASEFSSTTPRKVAGGELGEIGWHTFRHTYRSWLDETGAPMKVQQELMRHASIQTTMNIYGQAMSSSKREANGKVVDMVLKLVWRAPENVNFLIGRYESRSVAPDSSNLLILWLRG